MSQAKVTAISSSKASLNEAEDAPEPSARRRVWTAKQKLEVIAQIDELKKSGADVGAFIRKKGLYSSTISLWRKQRNQGLLGVEGKKRGPKSKVTPEMIEIQRLQKENEKLSKSLSQAQKIIVIQKKVAAMYLEEKD
ncbi:MAG: transposase [Silvanigrellales bacterium]|nr:transposase [Silvanigrellales bacterium]